MSLCFVIMPFSGTTESHTKEYWIDHFEYFIKPAIEGASNGRRLLGYQAKLSDPAGGGIIGDVFKNLQEADVVLADLTDFNPNVMYELGIRHSLRDKTIMVLEEGMPIPFYFQSYKIIRYPKRKTTKDLAQFKETIQRRLIELTENRPNPSDNPISDYFKGIGQKIKLVSQQQEINLIESNFMKSDFSTIYIPGSNAQRNVRKEEVLRAAREDIKLLATTGHSYLAMVGSRFKGQLIKSLGADIPVKVILLNPWTECGILLALGELSKDSLTKVQETALEMLEKGNLAGFDPVALIENSLYYRSKLHESIEGYINLKKEYHDGIELRLCPYEIAVTLLLTEQVGFFEPYIHANLLERFQSLMLTFEIEFTNKSHLYRHSIAYFDILWKLSTVYEKFLETESNWKVQLREIYEWKNSFNDGST